MRTCRGAVIGVFLALVVTARSELVFDNTTNYQTNNYPSLFEFGDEITLGGSARTVTNFIFEYFGDFSQGNKTAQIRFYANDGPGDPGFKAPGTLLFESGSLPIFPGQNFLPLEGLNVRVPDRFTWTVQFSGASGVTGDQVGLVIYHPPTVGSSFRDFWANDGSWKFFSYPGFSPPASFGSRISAAPNEVRIQGAVAYYTAARAVPAAVLQLSGAASQSAITSSGGAFEFLVPSGQSYSVAAAKTGDAPASQGVTTLDLALFRRHLLALQALDSPYKIIAGDVNDSQTLTTLDIVLIRRLILAFTNNLPAGLWKFVRSDYTFADPQVPWAYESARSYTGPYADAAGQDFIAIKLGDANGSWTAPVSSLADVSAPDSAAATAPPRRQRAAKQSVNSVPSPAVKFALGHALDPEAADRILSVPVLTADFTRVTTVQFTLEWDPAIFAFAAVRGIGLEGLSEDNFGAALAPRGILTVSWDDPAGVGITLPDGAALFTLELKKIGQADPESRVRFADSPTPREVSVEATLARAEWEDLSGAQLLLGEAEPELRPTGGAPATDTLNPRLRIERGPATLRPQLTVLGHPPGRSCEILVSADLENWQPWTNLVTTGAAIRIIDGAASATNLRFYRLFIR